MAFEVNNQAHTNTVWLGWQFEVNNQAHTITVWLGWQFKVNNQAHINTVWLGWQFEVNNLNHWSTHALEKKQWYRYFACNINVNYTNNDTRIYWGKIVYSIALTIMTTDICH